MSADRGNFPGPAGRRSFPALRRLSWILAATTAGLVVAAALAKPARAVPPSTVDPCQLLLGPAKTACRQARSMAGGVDNVVSAVTDPLGSIAKACAQAAAWLIMQFGAAVNATTQVDFTNPAFLRRYAIVFGACTFLTLILWILGVLKRAIGGVPPAQAIGEAIGLLWLSVLACAFTPAVLAMLIKLTDDLTTALLSGVGEDTNDFLADFVKAIPAVGGGPIVVMIVSLLALAAALILWLELLIRAGMLYVGAMLGCAVYSGLVDRSLWRHVRRWIGLMVAVLLAKPVIVIVLSLAAALVANPAPAPGEESPAMASASAASSLLAGLAVMFLAIFASMMIYRFVPTFGDDMAALHQTRRTAQTSGPASAVNGPATYMKQGISTHAHRPSGGGTVSGSAAANGGTRAASGAASAGGPVAAGAVLAAGQAKQTASATVRQGMAGAEAMTAPAAPPRAAPPPAAPARPPAPRPARPSTNGATP